MKYRAMLWLIIAVVLLLVTGCSDKDPLITENIDLEDERIIISDVDIVTKDVLNDHINLNKIIEFEADFFRTWEPSEDEYAEQLIGEWHGSAFVAAGYAQRYHFYDNGKFIYRASEMDGETRIRSIRGIWSVDHDTLSLNINEIDEIIGGEEVPASGSVGTEFEIVNGELVTKSVDYEEIYRLGPIEEKSELMRPKIEIDGVTFWRHSQNPDFY